MRIMSDDERPGPDFDPARRHADQCDEAYGGRVAQGLGIPA